MNKQNEWRLFFDAHAPQYMQESFTQHTQEEVSFIVDRLSLPKGCSILDVGCGTGRHAIALAKRGYKVAGVDISEQMLKEAQKTGEEADVTIHWIHEDAARFSSQVSYDAAICICEGGFGLLGTADDPEEHDRAILDNIHACLIEKAGLILTVPNGLKKIRQFNQGDVQAGNFDPYYLLETFTVEWNTPEGSKSVQVKERGYTPLGLARLLEDVGFKVQGIYGGTAGRWALRKPELDEMELMAICQRI